MKQEAEFRARAKAIVQQMTAEEKLGLLTTHQKPSERLGLPEFYIGTEVARGFVGREPERFSTVLPQPIGIAATFDAPLAQKLGEIAGDECRAYFNESHRGGLCVWGPTVDMERDPRWGRTEEAYGEDVCLAGTLSAALTRGMAGYDETYMKTVPTLKHFCANNTENTRAHGDSFLPPRLKYEYYYAAFMPAVCEGGARSVMAAYNAVNGVPAMCNPDLRDILHAKWGLWFAVTDGGAYTQLLSAHRYCESYAEALAEAIRAGCEVMTDNDEVTAEAGRKALREGLLKEEELDDALEHVIYTRLRLGMLAQDCPYDSITKEIVDSEAARAVNRRAAEEQIVLLKNDGLLPIGIEAAPQKIAVVGALADENLMDWYTGHFRGAISVLEGIRREFPEAQVSTDSLWDLVAVRAANGKYLSAHEDGSVTADAEQIGENELFELQSWGENWNNFYSRKYARYIRLNDDCSLRLHNRRIYDWFTKETFRLIPATEGTVLEEPLFGRRLRASDDGRITAAEQHTVLPEACFRIEVQSSGAERARAIAASHDLVLYCVGNHPVQVAKECYDRKTLRLNVQEGMAAVLHAENPDTAMILISSYPYAVCEEQAMLPAILYSTHAGAHLGEAVAGAVSGRVNPAGRLPMTWYRSEADLPDLENYDIESAGTTYLYFRGKALYPFGYGLSYSAFRYLDLKVRANAEGGADAEITLQNTSERSGEEVVQVYYHMPHSAVSRPIRKLCGFARVQLGAGETKTVSIRIPAYLLQYFDVRAEAFRTEPGEYCFLAGGSSDALPLCCTLTLAGQPETVRRERFEAQYYDRAAGVRIGYARALHQHYVKTAGWSATLIYEQVPLKGKRLLTIRAAAMTQPGTVTAELCGETYSISVLPGDGASDFRTYRVPLPEGLPETGTLRLTMPGGMQLLDLCVSAE
ncbi:MAG: glycoside hydrolase family 3 C-terminal domain-containing protein [Oscillospiraceae bacterium]|nr:glycoside hydrolase family 3 C-terminal domain-containing protein [Oscillospiraceae bacterium]